MEDQSVEDGEWEPGQDGGEGDGEKEEDTGSDAQERSQNGEDAGTWCIKFGAGMASL